MDLAPFADIDPCGYPGPRRDAARRSRRRADASRTPGASSRRSSRRTSPLSALTDAATFAPGPTCPDPPLRQRRRRQAQRRREDRAHPDQGRPGRAPAETRLDPRARAVVAALRRDQEDPARAQPAHGVRGSLVPEHRRVLQQRHGDVHDHGRHLHAALPVLRRRPRPAAAARCRRAGRISRRRSRR